MCICLDLLSFLSETLFSLMCLGLYFLCYCEWKYFVNFIFVLFVVYSNTIDFYIFILYPETLVLVSLKKNCLGFSTFRYHLQAILPLPFQSGYLCFSCTF